MTSISYMQFLNDLTPRRVFHTPSPQRQRGSATELLGLSLAAAVTLGLLACGMVFFLPLAWIPAHLGRELAHRLDAPGSEGSNEPEVTPIPGRLARDPWSRGIPRSRATIRVD
jgi:hypothetical protein